MGQEMSGQMPDMENWGDTVGEIRFTNVPDELDEKKPQEQEDPESPELTWSQKVTDQFIEDHDKGPKSDELPN